MFTHPQPSNPQRWSLSLTSSVAAHFLVLMLLSLRPAPIFVKSSLTAHGNRGTSTVLYFAKPGPQEVLVARQARPKIASLYSPVPINREVNAKVTSEKNTKPQNSEVVSATPSGSPYSSDLNGSDSGADVRPAIEISLVDPPVSKSEIPAGIEGDVIVEITIDEQGNVIGAKLLKGLGYGIDEKILATVRNNWHYRPATRDGVPIPSKYDARWHFRG
ncbi:MAG TPA: TonB family protein [Candidatus Angelobacter sp.]|nr:TonB family protein [Candidatus Angelobacter sp.]